MSDDERRESGRVRVLVVDDSALMRRLLTDLLRSSPEIEVVGSARDGREAIEQAARLRPDVITLDVEMPEVSGLDALPTLLAVHEAPVVMVSALTQEGAEVTLQALELGAVDYLPKPQKNTLGALRAERDLLVAKVLGAARSRVRIRRSRRPALELARPTRPAPAPMKSGSAVACVVIGISTGGPQALGQVLPALTPPMPPILIVQHMLAEFTGVFAARLDRYTDPGLRVKIAEEGDPIRPETILIAPGGRHLGLVGTHPRVRVAISDAPDVSGHRPSIDVLFQAAARAFGGGLAGILMTGMGRDGVDGCKAILAAGGSTYGQDEATSVVYGMNKTAFLEGAIQSQFALDDLPAILRDLAATRSH